MHVRGTNGRSVNRKSITDGHFGRSNLILRRVEVFKRENEMRLRLRDRDKLCSFRIRKRGHERGCSAVKERGGGGEEGRGRDGKEVSIEMALHEGLGL